MAEMNPLRRRMIEYMRIRDLFPFSGATRMGRSLAGTLLHRTTF